MSNDALPNPGQTGPIPSTARGLRTLSFHVQGRCVPRPLCSAAPNCLPEIDPTKILPVAAVDAQRTALPSRPLPGAASTAAAAPRGTPPPARRAMASQLELKPSTIQLLQRLPGNVPLPGAFSQVRTLAGQDTSDADVNTMFHFHEQLLTYAQQAGHRASPGAKRGRDEHSPSPSLQALATLCKLRHTSLPTAVEQVYGDIGATLAAASPEQYAGAVHAPSTGDHPEIAWMHAGVQSTTVSERTLASHVAAVQASLAGQSAAAPLHTACCASQHYAEHAQAIKSQILGRIGAFSDPSDISVLHASVQAQVPRPVLHAPFAVSALPNAAGFVQNVREYCAAQATEKGTKCEPFKWQTERNENVYGSKHLLGDRWIAELKAKHSSQPHFSVSNAITRLGTWLQPYRTARSKSNYGRFFCGSTALAGIVTVAKGFLRAHDYYVDFSAGDNRFGAALLDSGTISGYMGFDVFPPAAIGDSTSPQHFRVCNWFDVQRIPDNAVIGLNPPFGNQGTLALQFIAHALTLQPVVVLLVTPAGVIKRWRSACGEHAAQYTCAHVNTSICSGARFFQPGTAGEPGGGAARIATNEATHVWVLVRKDVVADRTSHLAPSEIYSES